MPRKRAKAAGPIVRNTNAVGSQLLKTNLELSVQLRALRRSQRTLERARAHYADLYDFAPVTYALLDSIGIVLKINIAGCRLLNVERVHLIGHPLLAFAVQKDRRELLDHLRRCRNGKGTVESEIRFAAVGGGIVTCRVYSKRASYEDRDAFPTVIVDQTEHLALDEARLAAERRTAQAERESVVAREASAAKDRFLATVSHELRTPLTPALFAAGRLTTWAELPDEARLLAATIKRNIEFEARLIDDLLDVARINRDRIELRLVPTDVHVVLQEAVAVCNGFAAAKKVTIALHLLARAHHVAGDRSRLRQVFWNLLNNAIKFTEAGGNITVTSANTSDSNFRVSFRDTGTGMESATMETLFAPFDRQPLKPEARGGLGLGLAICKGIVGAHNGQVWATSDGPGKGSTFAVELATVRESAAGEAESKSSDAIADAGQQSNRPPRVLLIEDDSDSSEVLSLFLSQKGYEVEIAASLADAKSKLADNWDIVLSDIGLPDGSGLEVAERARRMPHPPQRLIAFTGYGSSEDVRASREAGFDDHVVKPIDFDRLLNSLTNTETSRIERR